MSPTILLNIKTGSSVLGIYQPDRLALLGRPDNREVMAAFQAGRPPLFNQTGRSS